GWKGKSSVLVCEGKPISRTLGQLSHSLEGIEGIGASPHPPENVALGGDRSPVVADGSVEEFVHRLFTSPSRDVLDANRLGKSSARLTVAIEKRDGLRHVPGLLGSGCMGIRLGLKAQVEFTQVVERCEDAETCDLEFVEVFLAC